MNGDVVTSLRGPQLTATYRLQMNAGFTLAQARARVEYFAALGVSHLYLSPIFVARRGSMHGYDVVDPTRVNPEIGTEADLRVLAQDVHRAGMGLILDIVPNHMGIGPENAFWDAVLASGERSPYARWFDIDWIAGHAEHRKLILPVLADDLERVLDRGEISIELTEASAPRIKYFAQSFPIDPTSLPPELQLAQADPEEAHELADRYSSPQWRDRLSALLGAQHYRLVFWRSSSSDINYRRFFDVNDLVALRMEDPSVFSETHDFVLRLVREGTVDGLRVDHVDGLLDPADYLARLRAATTPHTLIFVEKILSIEEQLPPAWPVQGTTGYEFLNDLGDVFVDPAGFEEIERSYRAMRGMGTTTFRDIARECKANVLRGPLRADVDRLIELLTPIAHANGHRWPDSHMAIALTDFIAVLPVYRTYLGVELPIDPADRSVVERASLDCQAVSEHPDIAAFVGGLILGDCATADAIARIHFVQRLQELSGPAAAKGIEDTAFYSYVPLASRNEVGGGPDRPLEQAVIRLHAATQLRAGRWPLALLSTNTHDTKRSADVRASIDALSEMPAEWCQSCAHWRRLNARHRQLVNGQMAPDANAEYLLYQTVVALWPSTESVRQDSESDNADAKSIDAARERIVEYMIKAAREAKIMTNWINPDAAYEDALEQFIAAILDRGNAEFLADVSQIAHRAAWVGARNSLSRITIHLTSPGTPDIYQGDELLNLALVDPDNRRQVDYDSRSAVLHDVSIDERFMIEQGACDLFDRRIKLLTTQRLLRLRRTHVGLFTRGDYRPLRVRGSRANHVIAFVRTLEDQHVVTIASRLMGASMTCDPSRWWGDTRVELPSELVATRWRDSITGNAVSAGPMLNLSAVLIKLPVAVLVG